MFLHNTRTFKQKISLHFYPQIRSEFSYINSCISCIITIWALIGGKPVTARFSCFTYSFTRLGQRKQKFIIFLLWVTSVFSFTCRIETLSNSKNFLLCTKRNDFCVVFGKKVDHIKVFIKNDF